MHNAESNNIFSGNKILKIITEKVERKCSRSTATENSLSEITKLAQHATYLTAYTFDNTSNQHWRRKCNNSTQHPETPSIQRLTTIALATALPERTGANPRLISGRLKPKREPRGRNDKLKRPQKQAPEPAKLWKFGRSVPPPPPPAPAARGGTNCETWIHGKSGKNAGGRGRKRHSNFGYLPPRDESRWIFDFPSELRRAPTRRDGRAAEFNSLLCRLAYCVESGGYCAPPVAGGISRVMEYFWTVPSLFTPRGGAGLNGSYVARGYIAFTLLLLFCLRYERGRWGTMWQILQILIQRNVVCKYLNDRVYYYISISHRPQIFVYWNSRGRILVLIDRSNFVSGINFNYNNSKRQLGWLFCFNCVNSQRYADYSFNALRANFKQ